MAANRNNNGHVEVWKTGTTFPEMLPRLIQKQINFSVWQTWTGLVFWGSAVHQHLHKHDLHAGVIRWQYFWKKCVIFNFMHFASEDIFCFLAVAVLNNQKF